MRLAIFHPSYRTVGGAEVLSLAQARALAEAGDEVHLVTYDFNQERMGDLLGPVHLHVVPRHHWSDLPFSLDRVMQYRWRGRRALKALRALEPEIVVCHNTPAAPLVGPSGLKARKVWYCHEPHRSLYPEVAFRNLWEAAAQGRLQDPELEAQVASDRRASEAPDVRMRRRKAFDQAGVVPMDAVIANSTFTRESIARVYGRKDVEVVCPQVTFPDQVPNRQGLDRSGLKILVQCRLERMKNVETLLRGVARVRARIGADPHVHIVGNGKGKAALEVLCAQLDLQDHVTFHGFLDAAALASLRRSCDVFALLPWDEPFGMVFPEAAAEGLLLIGPDHGGPMEILEEGALGACVPAWDSEAFGEACLRIWTTDDAELDRRRLKAYESCRARYSATAIQARLRKVVRGA